MFVSTVLALIVLGLRFYTRGVIVRQIGLDDWFMALAMLVSIGGVFAAMFKIKAGLGREITDLKTLGPFLHALFAEIATYNFAQTFYKLSIALQCQRLFSTSGCRKIVWLVIAWIAVCGIMGVAASMFYCYPVAKAWDLSLEGRCIDKNTVYYVCAGFNLLNDHILLALPFPFLVKLQIARKHRVVLCSVFSAGLIVTIVSEVRLKALYVNLHDALPHQAISGIEICMWSHLEVDLAIICGSIPALKAFFSQVILGHEHSPTPIAEVGSKRRAPRQSDEEEIIGEDVEKGYGLEPLEIRVQQSVEVSIVQESAKNGNGDDAESEMDLVLPPRKSSRTWQRNLTVVGGSNGVVEVRREGRV